MAKLSKLYLDTTASGKKELRISWDNDRHQAIIIENDDALGLYLALIKTINLLRKEIANRKI